jgi:hypothetical protein
MQHREHHTSVLPPAMQTPLDNRKHAQQAPGRDPAGCRAQRRQEPAKTRVEIDPRSHWRGEGFQTHLVEEEEGSGAHCLPRCRWRKSPEMAGICKQQRRHWLQERAREKERGRVSEAEWAGSV